MQTPIYHRFIFTLAILSLAGLPEVDTAMASDSPPIGDLSGDYVVNWADFGIFASQWRQDNCTADNWCGGADLDQSGSVNWTDFGIFAANWMECAGDGCQPEITYQVDPECAPGSQTQASPQPTGETRFSVTVQGRHIHFEDLVKANCCMDYIELQMTVDQNVITIEEIEHLDQYPCTCICDFPTTATLGPFADGTYTVQVIDPWYGPLPETAEVTIPCP